VKQVENTAKKWTKRKAVAVVIILWVQLIRCCCAFPSSARERKREREREIKEISISSLRCSFPPKRQESTDERDKNRTTNVSILLGLDTLNVFLSFGLRKRLRRRTKRYAPGDDFDDESGFFVFLFFFEKQRLH